MAAETTHLDPEGLSSNPAFTQGVKHVVKLNIYLVHGVDAQAGYAASRAVWGEHRTAITVISTAGHARPGALVEIDAVAIIPE